MRIYPLVFVLFCLVFSPALLAQTVLLDENFDECTMPAGWTTESSGGAGTYAVGNQTNTNSNGNGIDGSCLFYWDDDADGNGSPAWGLKLKTPEIDTRGHTYLKAEFDLHFRGYQDTSVMRIYVFDGTSERLIWEIRDDIDGNDFDTFRHFELDISGYANEDLYLAFEYEDEDIWAWWAGIDNVSITGSGTDENVLVEHFDDCQLPSGWTTDMIAGDDDWQFGISANTNSQSNAINGTCFAFFDDDIIGQDAPFSRVRLISPQFDGVQYATYVLELDLIHRFYELSTVSIYILVNGEPRLLQSFVGNDVDGTEWADARHLEIDFSQYRGETLQLMIEFWDDDTWTWYAGIDNVHIHASGLMNDICENAINIDINDDCVNVDNSNAIFDASMPSCYSPSVGGLWYEFEAPSNGKVRINTGADFNDIITVFNGNCGNLQEFACYNKDELGFAGEDFVLTGLSSGQDYFLRVSGVANSFGRPRGTQCVSLSNFSGNLPPAPINDLCADAETLVVGDDCKVGTNCEANTEAAEPEGAQQSRASVWYEFEAPASESVVIDTDAQFSDVITVFAGNCSGLLEIASNPYGQELRVDNLDAGDDYYIQIRGNFATVEGDFCISIREAEASPANDICLNSTEIAIDADCTPGQNLGANTESLTSTCDVSPHSSIWFHFFAPSSGMVEVESEADFPHLVSVFSGLCSAPQDTACLPNPDICSGKTVIEGLNPGQRYFLVIRSMTDCSGPDRGNVCVALKAHDGSAPVSVSLKVLLEGPYIGNGQMHTQLADQYLVPREHPYDVAPWNHTEIKCMGVYPMQVVDWVLVEARTGTPMETGGMGTQLVERTPALLLADGRVVGSEADGRLSFYNLEAGDSYYFLIRHRNHLDVISSSPISYGLNMEYDFTSNETMTFGIEQIKMSFDGYYFMHAGEYNADATIQNTDSDDWRLDPSVLSTYSATDGNMDCVVQTTDYDVWWLNKAKIGISEVGL